MLGHLLQLELEGRFVLQKKEDHLIFKKLFSIPPTVPCLLIFGMAFNAVSFTKDSFHVPNKTWANYILDFFIAAQCKFYAHNVIIHITNK